MPERGGADRAAYEALLESVNKDLAGWRRSDAEAPRRPLLFVAGIPRSGTTLLYQLLAASGGFSYPSNLIARFYRAPGFGARVQRLLEPVLERGPQDWTSSGGNTEHWWGPHEFGYFWRHHLPFADHHQPDDPAMESLTRAVAAFEAECSLPLLFKNGILAFVLVHLAAAMPTSRFVRIHRLPLDVAVSLHRMRVHYLGDPRAWWSLRPRAVDVAAPAAEQIAHQIASADRALRDAAAEIGSERWIDVSYDDLCADTHGVLAKVGELMGTRLSTAGLPRQFPLSQPGGTPLEQELLTALEARGLA